MGEDPVKAALLALQYAHEDLAARYLGSRLIVQRLVVAAVLNGASEPKERIIAFKQAVLEDVPSIANPDNSETAQRMRENAAREVAFILDGIADALP